MSKKILSMIIPAHNEEKTLPLILEKIYSCKPLMDQLLEIIIVEDGSSDNTANIIKKLRKKYKLIKPFFHKKNMGKSAAVKNGISRTSGEYVIIQDADSEYDPAEIPDLLNKALRENLEVVYGNRFGKKNKRIYLRFFLGNQVVTFFSNIFTYLRIKKWIPDMEVCYKLIKGDLIREIGKQLTAKSMFGIEPEITARLSKYKKNGKHLKFGIVPISYFPRTIEEGKHIRAKHGIYAIREILKYNLTDDTVEDGNSNILKLVSLAAILISITLKLISLAKWETYIDADEAVVGLMAKNIANFKDWPFYYWGQGIIGALEPYCVALLYYISGTASTFLLKLVPTIFWYASFPLLYSVWKKATNEKTAAIAMILLSFPGFFFIEWASKARGGFAEIVFFGALALWLLNKDYNNRSPKNKTKNFLLGIICGISYWINGQALAYILPIFALQSIAYQNKNKRWRFNKSNFLFLFLGTLLALAPMIIYELRFHFPHTNYLMNQTTGSSNFFNQVTTSLAFLFSDTIPRLIGVGTLDKRSIVNVVLSFIIYLSFISGTILVLHKQMFIPKKFTKKNTFIYTFVLSVLLFLFSAYGYRQTYADVARYLILTIFFVPLCFALLINQFSKYKIVWIGALFFFLGFHLYITPTYYRLQEQKSYDNSTVKETTEYLLDQDIKGIYGDYWDIYLIMFYTNEEIAGSSKLGPVEEDRYQEYPLKAFSVPLENLAFVISTKNTYKGDTYDKFVMDLLDEKNISYKTHKISETVILTDFSQDPRTENYKEINLYYEE